MTEQDPGSNMAQPLSVQNQDKLDTIMQQLNEMKSKMQGLENKISETQGFLSGQTQGQVTYASVSNHVTPVMPHTVASTTTKSNQRHGVSNTGTSILCSTTRLGVQQRQHQIPELRAICEETTGHTQEGSLDMVR